MRLVFSSFVIKIISLCFFRFMPFSQTHNIPGMLCVCEKGSVPGVIFVGFFFFIFANDFPPHVTVRFPLLKGIVTFWGCKIWNV